MEAMEQYRRASDMRAELARDTRSLPLRDKRIARKALEEHIRKALPLASTVRTDIPYPGQRP